MKKNYMLYLSLTLLRINVFVLMAMTHMQHLLRNFLPDLSLDFMSHVRYLSGDGVRENDKHR